MRTLLPLLLAGCVFEPPAAVPTSGDAGTRLKDSGDQMNGADAGFAPDAGPADSGSDAGSTDAAMNRPPQANDDTLQSGVGAVATIDVLANDTDPDGDALTILSVGGAQSGMTEIVGGAIEYRPPPAFVGQDSFSYVVSDGAATDSADVTIEVVAPPLAINPNRVQMNLNSWQDFGASGGVGPYAYDLEVGTGQIDATTGIFFSGHAYGGARVRATDALGNTVSATVTFGTGDLFYVGGVGPQGPSADVSRSPDGISWASVSTTEAPVYLHAAVVFDDAIWVAGGRDNDTIYSYVERSIDGQSFDIVGVLPTFLRGSGLLVHDQRMVLIGGTDEFGTVYSTVWTSSTGRDWQAIGDLPAGRSFGMAARSGDRLWYVGGFDGLFNRDEVFASDDGGASWQTLTALPLDRRHAGVVGVDTRLRVLGGIGTETGFDDAKDTHWATVDGSSWTNNLALPVALQGLRALIWNGSIHVIGGSLSDQNADAQSALRTFDGSVPEWRTVGNMNEGRYWGTVSIFTPKP